MDARKHSSQLIAISRLQRNGVVYFLVSSFFSLFSTYVLFAFDQNSQSRNNPQLINQYLKSLTQQNGDIATALSIGNSSRGHELLIIDIQHQKTTPSKTVYIGALHHGNEFISLEASVHFLESLFINKEREFVKRLLKDLRILIQPMSNPDGFEFGKREDAKGIDINRDFEFPSSNSNEVFRSEISQYLKLVFERIKVDAAISLHSGTKAILYPWCYTDKPIAEQRAFDNLAQLLASHLEHQSVKQSYFDYPTKGELIDYLYMKYKSYAFTVEIHPEHWIENTLDRQRLLERTTRAQFMFLDAIAKNISQTKETNLELNKNVSSSRALPQYINLGLNAIAAPQP